MVKTNALNSKLAYDALFAGWPGVQIIWLIGSRPWNGYVWKVVLIFSLFVSKSQATFPVEAMPICDAYVRFCGLRKYADSGEKGQS